MNLLTTSTAVFSPCRRYRYTLTRRWADGPLVNWLMLNPSTADEVQNDPTIERCEVRTAAMGYGGYVVTNLFAWRDTSPKAMKAVAFPIGDDNDKHILEQAVNAAIVICGWGGDGNHRNRQADVLFMLNAAGVKLHYLRLNGDGTPAPPLYLPYNLQPTHWVLPNGRRA